MAAGDGVGTTGIGDGIGAGATSAAGDGATVAAPTELAGCTFGGCTGTGAWPAAGAAVVAGLGVDRS